MSRSTAFLLTVFCSIVIAASPAFAGTTGGISGHVVDDSGAPLAGAKVTAASPSQTANATTDAKGFYSILNLSPDTYSVTATKDGYDAVTVSGFTVQADQSTRADFALKASAKVIGHVTTSAQVSVVSHTVTGDLYAVNAQAINTYQGSAGGAETLYSQNGVVGSLPGVLRDVGTGGGYGGNGSISMRGGTNDQVGFELEGIPLNRSFDAANATSFVTNGLSSLEVYTGGEPADAGRSMAGYINEQINRGRYPGGADLTLVAGAPVYNHSLQADAYGGTPDQRFSWYFSTLASNADYNFGNRNNLDNTVINVAANDPTCPFFNTINGSNLNCSAAFQLNMPISHAVFWNLVNPSAAIRDNVLNLHYLVPHDGLSDDLQALYVTGTTSNPFAYSGGRLDPNLADDAPAGVVLWPSGTLYLGKVGQPYDPSLMETLTWPSSHNNTGAIPANYQDHQDTQNGIEKLGYTRVFSSSSFLRFYAYSLYSLWAFDQATNPFVGDSWYQLHDNETGATLNYQNQLNAQHLLRIDVDYVKDLSLRYNYAPDFFGFDCAPNTIGSNSVCSDNAGANTLCGSISGGPGGLTNCENGGGIVAFKGEPYAYWNNLPDINSDVAVADTWHASDNLLFDIGVRFDRFHIEPTPLQITGPNGIAEIAQNQFGTCLDGYNYGPSEPCFGYLTNIQQNFPNVPSVAPGAANWQNVSGSLDFNEFSPRFGLTYTLPDRDVLRFSVGRYVEPPNTYGEQYIAAPQWGAGDTVSVLNNFYDGLGFLAIHHLQPQDATNYDASYERDFGGGWSAKVTPFVRITRNQVLSLPVTPNNPTFETGYNFGTARIRGSELLLRKARTTTDGLSTILAATYTDTKLRYERTLGATNFIDTINSQITAYNTTYGTKYPLFDPNGYYSPSAFQAFGAFTPSYDVKWVVNLTLDEHTHGFDFIPTFNYQSGNPYGDPLQFPDMHPSSGLNFGPDPYTGKFDGLGSLVGPSWLTMNFAVSHDLSQNMKAGVLVTNVFTAIHNHGYPWELPTNDQVLSYEDNEFYGFGSFGGRYAGDAYYPYAPSSINPVREYVFTISTRM
ncbi:MAG TPA: TonB-dependent receptor [Candidatus Eremiobacteraceae bacterium]|nr:TonB-dependent receptor [Candidatus Eremiobacteraceae bacterium]